MKPNALKLELIEWVMKMEDEEKLTYLKEVKDLDSPGHDWWDDLTNEQKAGIERGLKDIEEGRTVSHEEVIRKYGLEIKMVPGSSGQFGRDTQLFKLQVDRKRGQ